MPEAPSIGVLIPTRNSAALLPGHLESLKEWIDLAEEVIVVDSDSTDGTVAMLRAGLKHPRVRFLTHPPGLYQSWNFGIQNIKATYVYIATVGDSITRPGLEHLRDVAEKFQSDAVISKPHFIDSAGNSLPDSRWMIDEIRERARIVQPRLLSVAEQFLFAVTNTWGAILGNSASNLYRAKCFQERPFPTDFGMAGDGAWGIRHIFDARIAITPERFSTFRHHEKSYSLVPYQVESLAFKLFRLVETVIAEQRPRNPAIAPILQSVNWPDLEKSLNLYFVQQEKLEKIRRSKIPWLLQPSAWQARLARGHARREITRLTDQYLAKPT